jgi:hypothetical protein
MSFSPQLQLESSPNFDRHLANVLIACASAFKHKRTVEHEKRRLWLLLSVRNDGAKQKRAQCGNFLSA